MVWGVLGKVVQSNERFGLSDRLEVHLHHVSVPTVNGRMAEKTKGRSLGFMSDIKNIIVKVKAEFVCLDNALIIAVARVNGYPNYKSYRDSYCLELVQDILSASGVDLINGGVFKVLQPYR